MNGYKNQPVLGALNDIVMSSNKNIRLFTVNKITSDMPKDDFEGEWQESVPKNVANFSAAAYYFGRMINKVLNVPVGLIIKLPVTIETPFFRNIQLSSITSVNVENALIVKGLPEAPVEGLSIVNSNFSSKNGFQASFIENAEYELLSKRLIDSNTDFSDGRKSYEHKVSDDLKDKIDQIINLNDITIEIIGSWIWVTGNTRPLKEELKKAEFRFSRKKLAWYWHCGEYRKKNKNHFDLDELRNMWGTDKINPENEQEQAEPFTYNVLN